MHCLVRPATAASTAPLTLKEERVGVEFDLDDGTDRVAVEPSDASVFIVMDTHTESGYLNEPTEAQRA